jgi:hypothetical protein
MEVARSSETPMLFYQTTRRFVSGSTILGPRCESLRCNKRMELISGSRQWQIMQMTSLKPASIWSMQTDTVCPVYSRLMHVVWRTRYGECSRLGMSVVRIGKRDTNTVLSDRSSVLTLVCFHFRVKSSCGRPLYTVIQGKEWLRKRAHSWETVISNDHKIAQ